MKIPEYFYFKVYVGVDLNILKISLKDCSDQDEVEIIRCGQCKYCDWGLNEDGELFYKCIGPYYGGTTPFDYCAIPRGAHNLMARTHSLI